MGLKLIINGTDYSDYLQTKGIKIQEIERGERNRLSLTLVMVPSDLRPRTGHVVVLYDEVKGISDPEFQGLVLSLTSKDIGPGTANQEVLQWEIACGDATVPLQQRYVTDSWVNKTTGFILVDAIAKLCPHIDVSQVPNGTKTHPFWGVELQPLAQFIDELASVEGWNWYLDGYTLRMHSPTQQIADLQITDVTLHELAGVGIEIAPEDATQVRNVVFYQFLERVTDGLTLVTTASPYVFRWDSDGSISHNRYKTSSAWSAYEPSGTFTIAGTVPVPGSPGSYSVQAVNATSGNLTLSGNYLETATAGQVDNSVAPTYKSFRAKATTADQVLAFDRLNPGDWLVITTTAGDQSRYVKSVVKSGSLPAIYYAVTFGDGNPVTAGDPTTAADAPSTATVPTTTVNNATSYWAKLENYIWTDIPSVLRSEDTQSISALKALLNNGDTGIREDIINGEFVMTFQEAWERARLILDQFSNPLVSFQIRSDSWTLKQLGQVSRLRPILGVRTVLSERGINAIQTLRAITREATGGLDPDGHVVWKVQLDFADRLFYLQNIIKRLKQDLTRLGSGSKIIRGVVQLREIIPTSDRINITTGISLSESLRPSDQVSSGAPLALSETGSLSDLSTTVALSFSEISTLSDSLVLTDEVVGPFHYGVARLGFCEMFPV